MSFQDVMREVGEFLATPLYTIGDTPWIKTPFAPMLGRPRCSF